jgi:hypothetical protein
MEGIIHSKALTFDEFPNHDIFTADGDNALNLVNRLTGLMEIRDHNPKAFAMTKNMYLHPSRDWYFGMSDEIRDVGCANGFHQGDVMATFGYVMTIQPLLNFIKGKLQKLHPTEVHMVNFVAPFRVMKTILKILCAEETFLKYGYKLKKNKACYLMGKCENNEAANSRYRVL